MARNGTKKITKAIVDRAKYSPAWKGTVNKTFYIWDSDVPGFGLRIYPSGRKAFVLGYRIADTRRRRFYTLGTYPALTVLLARNLAQKKLAEVYAGSDPVGERKRASDAMTVEELADLYLERYASQKKSYPEDKSRVNRYIKPILGSRKITGISRSDVAELVNRIGRKSIVNANRVLVVVSMMYKLALEWGLVPDNHANPAQGVRKFKEKSRERFLTHREAADLIGASDEEEDRRIQLLVRLYLFTGARKDELLSLQWTDVDNDNQRLRFRETKSGKDHWIKPAQGAWTLFEELAEYQELGNPYVFTGRKPGTRMMDFKSAWKRIRGRAGLEDIRVHDLRRTAASWLAQSGISSPAIRETLGHANLTATEVYARTTGKDTEAPLARLGEIFDDVEKLSKSKKVVPIK